ncbi:MAG: hemerythrin family protein [Magnetococcales bacterium]|nr:hemerythrin family protein [Magnetococcales bacterium]MBF0322068.1 hemerythrin family protein [Magnetococcales bacterium]
MTSSLWDEKYAIGIESIDQHHKGLAQALDDLVVAALSQEEKKVQEIFRSVGQYVDEHFHEEEALMEQASYPDLETHRLLHDQFRVSFHKIIQDFMAGKVPETVLALQRALYGWLFQHIYHVDQEYRPWVEQMKNKG